VPFHHVGRCVQVFCTLVEALLGDLLHDDDEIVGISYEHLFRLCRERFLTSSDATLRAHLTEYKDHDLLKTKKGADGSQLLFVPLPVADLKQLVETLKAE
jgi:origin recognition complex subunit 2